MARWQHYRTSPPGRLGFGTLVYLARKQSPGWTYESARDYSAEFAAEPINPVDLWGSFDPPELPKGLLPKEIEDYAFAQARTMGADPGGVAMAALAVCAAAIPDRIKLLMKPGDNWMEAARLWVALVGTPSTKKSPIITATMGPLARLDAILVNKYLAELKEWEQLDKDETQGAGRSQCRSGCGWRTPPSKPLRRCSQAVLMAFCWCRTNCAGSSARWTSTAAIEALRRIAGSGCRAFNGGPYALNRINRGVGLIPNLSVSLLGGIQPDVIRQLAGESYDDGFLQRMLMIMLRPATLGLNAATPGVSTEYGRADRAADQIASAGLRQLERRQRRRAALRQPRAGRARQAGGQASRSGAGHRDLQRKAGGAHRQVRRTVRAALRRSSTASSTRRSRTDRYPGIHTEDTAERVAKFMHQYLLPHAFAFYGGVLKLADDHDRLINVAGYILTREEKTVLTNRDVQMGCRTMRKLERRDIETVFEQLDALGWVTMTPGPRRTDPPHWVVNPAVHQKFTERAKSEAERRLRVREIVTALRGAGREEC